MFNCSAKYIKSNEIKNKNFPGELSKSDARWDGKQEFFLIGLIFMKYCSWDRGKKIACEIFCLRETSVFDCAIINQSRFHRA